VREKSRGKALSAGHGLKKERRSSNWDNPQFRLFSQEKLEKEDKKEDVREVSREREIR